MFKVNKKSRNKKTNKKKLFNKVNHSGEVKDFPATQNKDKEKEKTRYTFYQRISPGNWPVAIPTSTTKKDETQQRNIVIPSNRTFALRAVGSRTPERISSG